MILTEDPYVSQANPDPKQDYSGTHHNHALAIGGAHAAFKAGHINRKMRDQIIGSARAALKKRKESQTQNAAPPTMMMPKELRAYGRAYDKKASREFGSIAPPSI